MSNSDEDVLRFISASFPSVWALELMLALKSDRRAWARSELVSALRASDLVVNKAIDALIAAGIASADEESVSYLPLNRDVEDCLDDVERLYRTRPNNVRRVIVTAALGSASAFADAFRLRGDKKID